jgi:hypothetical protein
MPPFFLYVGVGIYLFWKIFKNRGFNKEDLMIICVSIYGVQMYYSAFRNIEGYQYEMALQPVVIILYVFLERFFIFLTRAISVHNLKINLLKRYLIYALICIIPIFSILYPLQRYKKRFFIIKYAKEFFLEKKGGSIIFPKASSVELSLDRAKGIIVPDWQAKELIGVTEYIKAHTEPSEIVFTYPDVGTYNFLTDRPCLGRFKTAMSSWGVTPECHRELMDALKSKRPNYIIHKIKYPEIEPYLSKVESYREEIYSYIGENYRVVKSFGNIEIYKIK